MPSIIRLIRRGPAAPRCRPSSEGGAIAAANENNMAWERSSVTFRLTDARSEALLSLAPKLGMGASPTAAIDLAIERAAGMGASSGWSSEVGLVDKPAEMLEELRAVLDACVALRSDAADAKATLDRVELRVDDLRLATAGGRAGATVSPTALGPDNKPTPLGQWLDRQIGADRSWVLVKARWIDARADRTGMAVLTAHTWGRRAVGLGHAFDESASHDLWAHEVGRIGCV